MALTNYGRGPTIQTINLSSDYTGGVAATSAVIPTTITANPPLVTGGPFADRADLELIVGTGGWAVTAVSNLQCVILPSDLSDADYEYCYVTSGGMLAPYDSELAGYLPIDAVTYAAGTLLRFKLGWHTSAHFKTAIYNPTSVALPITSVKLRLRGGGAL